jgi:hypothetical protein
MVFFTFALLALFVSCSPFNQGTHRQKQEWMEVEEIDPKYKIHPSVDPEDSTKIYVPKDLYDCFSELEKMLHPDLIAEMKADQEPDMVKYHFGLGMWMRNSWGLWSNSRLAKYFEGHGLTHPDDISGTILTSFYRYLHGEDLRLEEQIQFYRDYWSRVRQQEKQK